MVGQTISHYKILVRNSMSVDVILIIIHVGIGHLYHLTLEESQSLDIGDPRHCATTVFFTNLNPQCHMPQMSSKTGESPNAFQHQSRAVFAVVKGSTQGLRRICRLTVYLLRQMSLHRRALLGISFLRAKMLSS